MYKRQSLSVVHPENLEDTAIMANYQNANKKFDVRLSQMTPSANVNTVSFKGRIDDKMMDLSKVKQYKLANNMEIVLNPNKSDISTSEIVLQTTQPADVKSAVPAILSVILNEGSKDKNYDAFYKDVYKAGMSLKFDADFQSVSANVTSLASDTGMAIDLIKEVFEQPRFSEKSFNYAKELVREAVSNIDASASEIASNALFPNLTEFATKEQVLASIDEITMDDVKSFFNYIKQNAMAKGVFTLSLIHI